IYRQAPSRVLGHSLTSLRAGKRMSPVMPTKISILGDGAWGTAIALLLAPRGDHEVVLWSARPENARILRETRENRRLLPGVFIPRSVVLTEDAAEAVEGAELLVSAIPTVHLRATLR